MTQWNRWMEALTSYRCAIWNTWPPQSMWQIKGSAKGLILAINHFVSELVHNTSSHSPLTSTRHKVLSDQAQGRVCVLGTQSCPTLCEPTDCSSPGSSVHGTLQARILDGVAICFSRGSPLPGDWTLISCIAGISLPFELQQIQQGRPLPSFPCISFFVMFSFACIAQHAGSQFHD